MGRGSSYSLEDRYKAAAAFVATGTSLGASREVGIPVSSIRRWTRNEEFIGLCQEIRAEFGDRIKANLAQIIEDGMKQIQDRIRSGDYVLNKEGKLIRKPMSGRDLTIATGTMFDKLRIMEGQPTQIIQKSEDEETITRLAKLRGETISEEQLGKYLTILEDKRRENPRMGKLELLRAATASMGTSIRSLPAPKKGISAGD